MKGAQSRKFQSSLVQRDPEESSPGSSRRLQELPVDAQKEDPRSTTGTEGEPRTGFRDKRRAQDWVRDKRRVRGDPDDGRRAARDRGWMDRTRDRDGRRARSEVGF